MGDSSNRTTLELMGICNIQAASLLLSFGADPTNCWQEAERTKNEELLAMFKGKKVMLRAHTLFVAPQLLVSRRLNHKKQLRMMMKKLLEKLSRTRLEY